MAVNFYLKKQIDKNGERPVLVSINVRGTRFLTTTNYKISPSKWDADRQQVRRGATNASGILWSTINSGIVKIAEHFIDYENKCMLSNVRPDSATLKAEYDRMFRAKPSPKTADDQNQISTPGFWDYYELFIRERSEVSQWTKATHQKFDALKAHIVGWRQDVSFDDFTSDGLVDFIANMRDDEDLKNTTIGKQMGFLKWFLRWATAKGYNTNTAFQTFTPKLRTAQNQVVFLEWDELMKVFNYTIPENGTKVRLRTTDGKNYTKVVHDASALAKTRDVFCFCCFTSLRYSDAANLKRANISDGAITITTIKTADTLTIELNKYALAVLKRYEGIDLGGYALPHITNQRMNIYLKDLCELCEINRPITRTYYRGSERIDDTQPKYELIGTHTGRRTFICNALMLGIPAEIVMKWTGHADYKSMKPYIDVADKAKANAMSKFNDL